MIVLHNELKHILKEYYLLYSFILHKKNWDQNIIWADFHLNVYDCWKFNSNFIFRCRNKWYHRILLTNVKFVRFNHKSKIVMFLKLVSFQSDILIHVYVNFVRFNHKNEIIMFLKLVSFQSSVLVHLPFSVHQFGQITNNCWSDFNERLHSWPSPEYR